MGRPRLHDEQLRQRLLNAATHVLAVDGVDFSLRPLVAAAGTSTSAIYSLFGSRADLVDAVTIRAAASFIEAQRRVEEPTCAGQIIALARSFRTWAHAHPSEFQVVFAGRSGSAAITSAREATAEPMLEAIEQAITQGVLVGDSFAATGAIFAGLHGFVSLENVGVFAARDTDALFEQHLASLWRGWSNDNVRDAAWVAA